MVRLGLAIDFLQVQGLWNVLVDHYVMAAVHPSEPETEGLCELKKVMKREFLGLFSAFRNSLRGFMAISTGAPSKSNLILVLIRLIEKRQDLRPERLPVFPFSIWQVCSGIRFAQASQVAVGFPALESLPHTGLSIRQTGFSLFGPVSQVGFEPGQGLASPGGLSLAR